MWPRFSTRAALPVLLLASLALCGCAKTGLAWVNEPPSGGFGKRDAQAAAWAQRGELAPPAEPPEDEGPPLGINKTISLGESVTANDKPPPQSAQQEVLVVRTSPYYRPISYGLVTAGEALEPVFFEEPVLIDPDPIGVPQNPAAGVQPGRDFPPPTSFGPPFPFRAAPADPFAP